MQIDNRFDRALEIRFRNTHTISELIGEVTGHDAKDVKRAAIYLVDTLDLLWLGAQAAFESKARPEHAIELLKLHTAALQKMPSIEDMQAEFKADYETSGCDSFEDYIAFRAREKVLMAQIRGIAYGDVNPPQLAPLPPPQLPPPANQGNR